MDADEMSLTGLKIHRRWLFFPTGIRGRLVRLDSEAHSAGLPGLVVPDGLLPDVDFTPPVFAFLDERLHGDTS